MTSYRQILDQIHQQPRYPLRPGLERMSRMLEILGNPQKNLRAIHIAGTNGKGSIAAMFDAVIRQTGAKVGLYTSPALEEFRERIAVDGKPIPEAEVAELGQMVLRAAEIVAAEIAPPAEFEVVTALGFLYFAKCRCDFVVLETGLGGKCDSTNVVDLPLVSVITSISMDHGKVLGNSLLHIAENKCGIIKPGSCVVFYPDQQPGVLKFMVAYAERLRIPYSVPDLSCLSDLCFGGDRTSFRYRKVGHSLQLLGKHQVLNAITVVEAMQLIRERSRVEVDDCMISKGLADAKINGRLEFLSCSGRRIVLDAAHNPGGIDALTAGCELYGLNEHLVVVMGMLEDKDYSYCIAEMAKIATKFVATEPESGQLVSSCEVARIAKKSCDIVLDIPSYVNAIEAALSITKEKETILICGSIYLVGASRTYLLSGALD